MLKRTSGGDRAIEHPLQTDPSRSQLRAERLLPRSPVVRMRRALMTAATSSAVNWTPQLVLYMVPCARGPSGGPGPRRQLHAHSQRAPVRRAGRLRSTTHSAAKRASSWSLDIIETIPWSHPVYSAKAAAAIVDLAARKELKGPVVFWHTGGYHALFDPRIAKRVWSNIARPTSIESSA